MLLTITAFFSSLSKETKCPKCIILLAILKSFDLSLPYSCMRQLLSDQVDTWTLPWEMLKFQVLYLCFHSSVSNLWTVIKYYLIKMCFQLIMAFKLSNYEIFSSQKWASLAENETWWVSFIITELPFKASNFNLNDWIVLCSLNIGYGQWEVLKIQWKVRF